MWSYLLESLCRGISYEYTTTSYFASTSENIPSYVWSDDSDQPAHSRSLIWIVTEHVWTAKDAKFLYVENEESDQTARTDILIRAFIERTCPKVRFHTLWLNN